MKLKTVGYFKEMPHGRNTDPSIHDYINQGTLDSVNKIVDYLKNGVALIVSPGLTIDVIDNNKETAGTPGAYTDGIWVWPGDLAYYVKEYNLGLPDMFIDTMKKNNWKIPQDLVNLEDGEIEIDGIAL